MTDAPREITVEEIEAFRQGQKVFVSPMFHTAIDAVCDAARRALSQAGGQKREGIPTLQEMIDSHPSPSVSVEREDAEDIADANAAIVEDKWVPFPDTPQSVPASEEIDRFYKQREQILQQQQREANIRNATPDTPQSVPADELSPCPFCGGEAERCDLDDEANFGGSCIACKTCGASTAVHFDRKENLHASWNDRTPDAPLSQGEELEEEFARIIARSKCLVTRPDIICAYEDSNWEEYRGAGEILAERFASLIAERDKLQAQVERFADGQEWMRAERDKLKAGWDESIQNCNAFYADNCKLRDENAQLVERVSVLEDALRIADISINPPDRDGISLAIWNARLAGATSKIRAALRTSEDAK